MTMPPCGTSQADFTRPIGLMMDCHRRIEHFLEALRRVVERFGGGDLDGEGRSALETSLNYFGQAVPRHTADEEQSLFPRVRRSDDPAACEAMTELDRLEADHRLAESAHVRIDELGRRWLNAGRLGESDGARLRTLLDDLATAYADHIRLEDERVFVLGSGVLTAESLREVGEEMEQRRLEDPGREGSRCARRRRQRHRET
jgi:hemerythrin-like domain-containing protein